MIIVIGSPVGRLDADVLAAGGTASRVALAAAALGRAVQLVGVTGDDPTADGVVLDLARGGVGHVALLRDPGRATPFETSTAEAIDDDAPADRSEPAHAAPDPAAAPPGPALEAADVELGLRYLTDFAVVVLAEPVDPQTIAVVAAATRWGEARMVLVVAAGQSVPEGLPDDVVVFGSPVDDSDGAFAHLVGAFAAALDKGTEAGVAFRSSIASDGWTEAGSA